MTVIATFVRITSTGGLRLEGEDVRKYISRKFINYIATYYIVKYVRASILTPAVKRIRWETVFLIGYLLYSTTRALGASRRLMYGRLLLSH